MAVRPLQPDDLSALYHLYNHVTSPLAHGFPAQKEEFCLALRNPPPHLRTSVVLVEEQRGAIVGFLRAGVARHVPDRWTLTIQGDGMLFGPFVAPGDQTEGAFLLAAGMSILADRGASRAFAFDPVEALGAPFYNGGWCGLCESLPHVVTLFSQVGFRIRHRELCLLRSNLPLPEPPSPPHPLSLISETRDRSRFSIKLYDRGGQAGVCHYCRMYPARSSEPRAEQRGYIDGLSVQAHYQGRGLGRLLMLHALHRLKDLGCGSVSLTTGADNLRAQNLYYSLDFALVDSCLTLAGSVRSK